MSKFSQTISRDALLCVFRELIHTHRGYTAAARAIGLSTGYLHDICVGRRAPAGKALAALGYEEIAPRYRKVR